MNDHLEVPCLPAGFSEQGIGLPILFRRRPQFKMGRPYRRLDYPQAVQKVLDLVPVMAVDHRVREEQPPSFGRESDPARNARGPYQERARERSFEHENGVVPLLPDHVPIVQVPGNFSTIRAFAVPVDRPELEGDHPVHIGASFYHLAREGFEHQVDPRLGISRPKISEERDGEDRVSDESVAHDEYFSGCQFHDKKIHRERTAVTKPVSIIVRR